MKRIAVIGASIGGLVAAAELRARGFDVTILERGKAVGGLYATVDTPFGRQELGMHVLYLNDAHYRHLCSIFGAEVFHTWSGYQVDIGATHNFGRNFFNSVYPDVRGLASCGRIIDQILQADERRPASSNALQEVTGRFGDEAGRNVVAPILKKLWKQDAELLTKDAIQCFFDLRRMVVCDKDMADRLKREPRLDSIVANPDQRKPAGEVYGNRMAVRFRTKHADLATKVSEWLTRTGIGIEFDRGVKIVGKRFVLDDGAMDEMFDGCIVATPIIGMSPDIANNLDQVETSIYYLKLAKDIADSFPAYYILCHAPHLVSSRVVNYGAYTLKEESGPAFVLAIEAVHAVGSPPTEEGISLELQQVLPAASLERVYRLPRGLKIPSPSLRNAQAFDLVTQGMEEYYAQQALFFAGMRTDKGIFFSHHTIGLAYDAALECAKRLS